MLERVVRAKRVRCSFDLAVAIKIPYTREFDEKMRKASPGIENLMRRYDAISSLCWARKECLDEMKGEFGSKAVEETMEWARSGGALCLKRGFLDLPDLPVRARNKLLKEYEKSSTGDVGASYVRLWKPRKKNAKPVAKSEIKAPTGEKLEQIAAGEIEGEAMSACVLGKTGEEHFGRDVYILRRVAGMFGDSGSLEYTYRCTAVNGIVNQYPLSETPGRFWVVMDVASELKEGFGKEKLATRAMERAAELGVDCSEEECLAAWEIIRNHQFRKRKDGLCMGYLVEDVGGVYRVRSRNADETAGYFAEVKRRVDERVEQRDGVEPPVQPTEERPVSVVVEQMR